MDSQLVVNALAKLQAWCEREGFKGWDPYDGLNSKVFQAIPGLKDSPLCRLVMIQAFKRSPLNLRPLAGVSKDYNAKGIALFLQGYCNLYKAVSQHPAYAGLVGAAETLRARIGELGELLLSLRSKGDYRGACWGYNFDWQARRLFLFPKYTPTVVATNFCVDALLDAFEVTGETHFRDTALDAAAFVLHDLHRYACSGGFLFSYSPLPGNDTVYNASLLGSKLLARCYAYSGDERLLEPARASVQACCAGQSEDGSWVYGLLPVQSWIDSFHTGYNLDALAAYENYTGDTSFHKHLERGFDFYLRHFFAADGTPKYYHNRMYPIDIHCPGQLFISLYRLGRFSANRELAESVLAWTVSHMQDRRGYFYYQLKPGISSKIPYMRWSNAFMFNALSYYLLAI